MNCRKESYSLTENCFDMSTGEILRFPCQNVICEDLGSNPDGGKFPVWAQILIGLLATVAILVFAIFFLKKMATHTLTVVFGFVLGASMVPNPKNVDVEAAEFKDPGQNVEVPSAPPSYEVAVQN